MARVFPSGFQGQRGSRGRLFSPAGEDLFSAVDLLVEDVHFEPARISPFHLGRIEPLARGLVVQDENGAVDPAELKGYDHLA
jgi:hypothetical protein